MSGNRILYTPTVEKRKRKFFSRRSIFSMLVLFGIIVVTGGVLYALQASYFQISSIKIVGLISLDELEIRQKLSSYLDGRVAVFLPRKSFFFVSSRDVETHLLDAFPRIAAVSVAKIFPQELSVQISERKLWGIYCNDFVMESSPDKDTAAQGAPIPVEVKAAEDAMCAYVDQEGFAYELAPFSAGSLLIKIHGDGELEIPSQVISHGLAIRLAEFSKELKDVLGIDTSGYEFSRQISREFRVKTSEGFSLWINRDNDFAGVVKVLKTVLDEEIKDRRNKLEYADLRFGNKVFYKFKK